MAFRRLRVLPTLAKGRKFKAERVDQAVLGRLGEDLASDRTVKLLQETLQQLASEEGQPVNGRCSAALERRAATLTTQIDRTVDLVAATEDPAHRPAEGERPRAPARRARARLGELRTRKQQAASTGGIDADQVPCCAD